MWGILSEMLQRDAKQAEIGANRRRSQRVLLDIPVIVRGESVESSPFEEKTSTLAVNAHGVLVVLATSVALGGKLVLLNPETREEREGHIVYLGRPYARIAQVGIDFARPAPEFWPITTPPDDWKTS